MVITMVDRDITVVITVIAIKGIIITETTITISTTMDIIGINTKVDITDMVITTILGFYIDHTPIDIIDAMDARNYHSV